MPPHLARRTVGVALTFQEAPCLRNCIHHPTNPFDKCCKRNPICNLMAQVSNEYYSNIHTGCKHANIQQKINISSIYSPLVEQPRQWEAFALQRSDATNTVAYVHTCTADVRLFVDIIATADLELSASIELLPSNALTDACLLSSACARDPHVDCTLRVTYKHATSSRRSVFFCASRPRLAVYNLY